MAGEFDLIAGLFAPLTAGREGTFNLQNDAAVLAASPGHELVITLDTLCEGVHFLSDDPPGDLARKLLRVNLSDLAAMGAKPNGYLLSLARGKGQDETWIAAFCEGLAEDQALYGVTLLGGDTTRSDGPLVLSLTAIGEVPSGQALTRSGAKPGDLVALSGTLGEAALGLKLLKGEVLGLDETEQAGLVKRYHLPQPRCDLGPHLLGLASACLDVSDGLLGDLQHIAETSGLRIEIETGKLPLSVPAAKALARHPALLEDIVGGGDDYELVFTLAPERQVELERIAAGLDLRLTVIGRTVAGPGEVALLDAEGRVQPVKKRGWTHF